MLSKMRPFFLAILLSSLIVNIALFIPAYKYGQHYGPPRENGSEQTGANQPEANAADKRSPSVQIECDPNCGAKRIPTTTETRVPLRGFSARLSMIP
jgi:hypothetical protein